MITIDLLKIIERIPGIRYKELQRVTNMANGTLSYNIEVLAKNGLIKIRRDAGTTRLYPIAIDEYTMEIISMLRDESRLRIARYLLNKKHATYQELQKVIKRSFSTLTWHLDKMIESSIIQVDDRIGMNIYSLVDEDLIRDIIEKHIDVVDKFVDMWSDL